MQESDLEAPTLVRYVPTRQDVQFCMPRRDWYLPGEQKVQFVLPGADWNVPSSHGEQSWNQYMDASPAAIGSSMPVWYDPAIQVLHAVELFAPKTREMLQVLNMLFNRCKLWPERFENVPALHVWQLSKFQDPVNSRILKEWFSGPSHDHVLKFVWWEHNSTLTHLHLKCSKMFQEDTVCSRI